MKLPWKPQPETPERRHAPQRNPHITGAGVDATGLRNPGGHTNTPAGVCDANHALALARSHVVKRLQPSQAGALKLARRYGETLVCVRYRHDETGRYRYTTVELVVDHAPIHRPQNRRRPVEDDEEVSVFIALRDATKRRAAAANDAKWDPRTFLWRMPRSLARRLRLLGQIRHPPLK